MMEKALELKLSKEIDQCKRCPLYKTRKNAVAGEGNLHSRILIIGEAPGKTEDEEKKPFAGRSGKILDMVLKSIDLSREDVYITNIVKCKPFPRNFPSPLSISQCSPFLKRQIDLIKPQIILTLGGVATKELCKLSDLPFSKISSVHGKLLKKRTLSGFTRLLPLYHPAAALRNPKILASLKRDLKKNSKLILKLNKKKKICN